LRDYASVEGIGMIEGVVLEENDRMLALCNKQGFKKATRLHEPGLVHVSLDVARGHPDCRTSI
jgi:acetyltransferase